MSRSNKATVKDVDVAALYNELKTHSAVFRYLFKLGYNYYQISKLTNKRPQHVRNVLVTPLSKN